MDLIKDLNIKHAPHFAENLQSGDRCLATIRHQIDGRKNILNAKVIVIENNKRIRHIKAWFELNRFNIPYNELSELK